VVQVVVPLFAVLAVVTSLLAAAAWTSPAAARPTVSAGSLDPTFGGDGIVTQDFGDGNADGFADVVVQRDGKILAVGNAWDTAAGRSTMLLARYLPSGALDPSFGTGGVVMPAPGTTSQTGAALAIQTDGRIVVVGRRYSSPSESVVYRFTSSGAVDTSFGGTGSVSRDWGNGLGSDPSDLIVLSSGTILVGGTTGNDGGDTGFSFGMLDKDGNNVNFTTNGTPMLVDQLTTGSDRVADLVATSGGRYYAIGQAAPTTSQVAVVRYLPSGAEDTSWGVSGRALTAVGVTAIGAGGALDARGRLLVAASVSYDGTHFSVAMLRYRSDGTLDPTFGGGGVSVLPGSTDERAYGGVLVRPDGSSVLVGSGRDDGAVLVARFDPTGRPDATFGTGGKVLTTIGDFGSGAEAVAAQADGRLVVVGGDARDDTQEGVDAAILRYQGRSTPTASITKPHKRALPARKFTKVAGSAGPAGVARVQVAIQRVDKQLLKQDHQCRWVKNHKGKLISVKAKHKKCNSPHWITATGTSSWKLKLHRRLPAGTYRIYARTTLVDGTTQTSFSRAAGNLRKVTLRG
jgi:uncharacterized delta-60 repeat protein